MFSAVFIMFWQLRLLDASYDYAKDYLAKDCFERKLGMNWDLKPQEPITLLFEIEPYT